MAASSTQTDWKSKKVTEQTEQLSLPVASWYNIGSKEGDLSDHVEVALTIYLDENPKPPRIQ